MILHKLPPFQNVGASQTAVMPFVISGMTVVGFLFKRGGTAFTAAHVSNVRCRLDGKQFADITGTHVDAVSAYERIGALANYMFLPFGDLNAKTQQGQLIGAIDTSIPGIKPMEMEVDIGAATAPTLEAWAILAPPKSNQDPNKFTIRAYLKAIHAPAAAGEFSQPIPLGSRRGALLHRLYSFHANVTKLQVSKDGLWLLQEGEEALLDYMHGLTSRTAQAGLLAYDPTFNDVQSDAIATLRPNREPADFQFKFTVSAADTITTYSSLYTTIDRV